MSVRIPALAMIASKLASNCVIAIASLLLIASSQAIACQENELTPRQEYAALLAEFNRASGGLRQATTDLERKEAVQTFATFSSQFFHIAESHAGDPIALTALRQAIQLDVSTDSAALQAWEMSDGDYPSGSSIECARDIVALVTEDYAQSEEIGPIIDRMRYGYRLEYELALTAVLERNPHREMQGLACLALAQFLQDREWMLKLLDNRSELEDCYRTVFGSTYVEQLQRLDRSRTSERIESLLERAADEYGDIAFRSETIGETAQRELFAIRHLSVGKTAPDIEGHDQDEIPFRLSDYRGQVVLIYFWSEY